MEDLTWSAENQTTTRRKGVHIYVNGQLYTVMKKVTKQDIVNIAKRNRIARFTVTKDDTLIDSNYRGFPIKSGTVQITEYNEAK